MKDELLQVARVTDAVEAVLEELRIDYYTVVIKTNTKMGDERTTCETTTDWEYRQASMDWCLPIVAVLTDLELRRTAVHEVVHVMVAEMEMQVKDKDLPNKLCERAVENVTRAILEILP
jgi:hypothetical protein